MKNFITTSEFETKLNFWEKLCIFFGAKLIVVIVTDSTGFAPPVVKLKKFIE